MAMAMEVSCWLAPTAKGANGRAAGKPMHGGSWLLGLLLPGIAPW